MENFPINISDYLIQNFVQTTESPVNTIINASFVLLNLTWTPDLANPKSAAFKAIADPFCQYLTNLYIGRDRFRDIYEKCEVASITTDGSREKINFVLQFKGQQDETLQEYIFGILIEIAPRTTVNGQISIVVGPLAVYEQSLAIEQATVAVVTTALPIGNMGAGVTSVRPDKLCEGVRTQGEEFRSTENCWEFIVCMKENPTRISCPRSPKKLRFDLRTKSCVEDPTCI